MTEKRQTTRSRRSSAKKPAAKQATPKAVEEKAVESEVPEQPESGTTEAPVEKAPAETTDKETQTEQASAKAAVAEKPEVTTDRFAEMDTSELTAGGKKFYAEGDLQDNPDTIYPAGAIAECYFAKHEKKAAIAARLADFIRLSHINTVEDLNRGYNMFKLLIQTSEKYSPGEFELFYRGLTEFVGNDVRVGGFFSKPEAVQALRNDPTAVSFLALIKRLAPSKDRKAVAGKTNYTVACSFMKTEQARAQLASLFV